MFTAPESAKCTKVEGLMLKVQDSLSYEEERPTYLVKIDGRLYPETAANFKIKAFPSFMYFERGQPTYYRGLTDTYEDIHNWLYKKTHDPVKEIESLEELWEFQD